MVLFYYTLQEQKAVEMFMMILKLPLYQTQQTKRYKDVDKFIKDGTNRSLTVKNLQVLLILLVTV